MILSDFTENTDYTDFKHRLLGLHGIHRLLNTDYEDLTDYKDIFNTDYTDFKF